MNSQTRWIVGNLRRLAKQQHSKGVGRKGKPLTPDEQMRRFRSGQEFARVRSGEISPTEYHRYQREMLKRAGVEV